MGQRFQVYVNYGKEKDHLFAMHLQWCWGPFAVVRAHQLVDYLDSAREYRYNPFGIGPHSTLGGNSFDGRREDLYVLRALTEINMVSKSIVEGHDLMVECNDYDKWRFEEGQISSFPRRIKMDPLAQDNNDGFLVVQASEGEVKYAFCKDVSAIEPVSAAEYLKGYPEDLAGWEANDQKIIMDMAKDLDGYSLLTANETTRIFDKAYRKDINIENFKVPEREQKREQPLSELMEEAKDRAALSQPSHSKSHISKSNDHEL